MRAPLITSAVAATLLATTSAFAQYNASAGKSAPRAVAATPVAQSDGTVKIEQREVKPAEDRFGNVAGNQFDLARDGAFDGETVAVLHLYTGEGFDFHLPASALKEKGFSVYRWSNGVPPVEELSRGLAKASQLWIVSSSSPMLTPAHLDVIQRFFQQGHGVYVWGDNEPYYADANAVASRLVGANMAGNLPGAQSVGLRRPGATSRGLLQDHLVTTGIEQLYEGITIATVTPGPNMQPLLYGSADNLVSAIYDRDGKRAIVDGGFTRLYVNWDTAGTARYVKNAAAWLANAERFGTPKHAERTLAPIDDPPPVDPKVVDPPVVDPPVVDRVPTSSPPPTLAPSEGARRWPWLVGVALIALTAMALSFFKTARRPAKT